MGFVPHKGNNEVDISWCICKKIVASTKERKREDVCQLVSAFLISSNEGVGL